MHFLYHVDASLDACVLSRECTRESLNVCCDVCSFTVKFVAFAFAFTSVKAKVITSSILEACGSCGCIRFKGLRNPYRTL